MKHLLETPKNSIPGIFRGEKQKWPLLRNPSLALFPAPAAFVLPVPHHFFFSLLLLAMLWIAMPLAVAGEAQPVAEDPVLEKRVMALAEELRCLKCQNNTLADSPSELAHDLLREIRTLMQSGKSDAEVVAYLVERYGEYVRFRPSMNQTTALLWFGPLILIVGGAIVLLITLLRRRKRIAAATPLSDAERTRAAILLNKKMNDGAGEAGT